MNLSGFINRPVLSTVLSVFIVIFGLIGIFTLPVERYPDIAPPTISVSANYPGANAETVVNSVLAPLEESINGVEGMTYMTSSASNAGMGHITINFQTGFDPDMAQVNVQNRVSEALSQLPAEVTRSGVRVNKRQTSTLLMLFLVATDDRYDATFLQNYADLNIIPQILRVYGVGEASVNGAKTFTMRIWLKPEAMARYGLTPTDVTAALSTQNIEAAPGALGENSDVSFQYTLTTKGRLKTPEEFGNIVLRSGSNSDLLRLKDVARVEFGPLSYSVNSQTDGHPSIMLEVLQAAGSNATSVINNVMSLVDDIRGDLPPGMDIQVGMNANDFLHASMYNVFKTLIEAFILVMLVVFIFLQDFRSTLIPAIAIPVSLIGTFFILKLLGFSLNLLVLAALVLAIAIVVDDAIVVVEAVHAKLDAGYKSAKKASIDAMSEIASTLISITLVMMAVFIPVSFLGGTSGVFYRQFGLTMAAAILLSGVNALTLSPALCAIFLKAHDEETGRELSFLDKFKRGFNTSYSALLRKYKGAVERISPKPVLIVGVVLVALGVTFFLMKITPSGFIPNEDTGVMMVQVGLTPGTSQGDTEKALSEVVEIIKAQPEVRSVTAMQGFGMMGAGIGSNYGTIFAMLDNWSDRAGRDHTVDAILGRVRAKASRLTNVQVIAGAPPTIPGFSMSQGFTFSLQDRTGGSIDDFYAVSQKFIGALNGEESILFARTSFNPSFPMFEVKIDESKLAMAGLTPATIYSTLQAYLGGMYVSNFNSFGHLYRVFIQGEPSSRANPADLSRIFVRNGNEMAPITQFISLEKTYGPLNISRLNMFNSIDIQGSPQFGYSSGQALAAVEKVAKETLPSGYTYEYSGLTREEQNTNSSMTLIILGLSLLFIYLLLSAQYESYLLPWSVILSVPFGLLGTFLFALIFGIDNNIYTQIALIMLIGLLSKNAILIVEFAKQRREAGMSIRWSAVAGAEARLRPILMTSAALIIGLIPLALSSGAGANGNIALGVSAIGGMLIGTLLQVLFVPGLYIIFQTLQEKFKPLEIETNDENVLRPELEQYTDIDGERE